MRREISPLALAVTLAVAACGTPQPGNSGLDASVDAGCQQDGCVRPQCQVPKDCGDEKLFDCVANACVPICTVRADCQSHPAYQNKPWPGCETGLCDCTARQCVPGLCTADLECAAGQVCRAGVCGKPDIDPDSCAIVPGLAVLRADMPVKFTATAYKRDAVAVLGPSAFLWSVGKPVAETPDAGLGPDSGAHPDAGDQVDAGDQADGALADPLDKVDEEGSFKGVNATSAAVKTTVTAAVKSKPTISCFAAVTVLPPISKGVRVVVIDELTGRLVSGATVIHNDVPMIEDSVNHGVFALEKPKGADPQVVSVFHQDFGYLTIIGALTNDFLVPLRRTSEVSKGAPTTGGGFKGTFVNYPESEVSIAIAGLSIPGDLTDLDITSLGGPIEPTDLTFPGKSYPNAPVQAGMMLGLGASRFKNSFEAWGLAGECTLESDVLAGTCGMRTGFGLMGTIPYSVVAPSLTGTSFEPTQLLTLAVPFLKGFQSAVVRDVSYQLKPVPSDLIDFYKDPDAWPTQDLTPNVGFALDRTVVVPDLPAVAGTQLDQAFIFAGSLVPGEGLVPLGFTTGTDTYSNCGTCVKNGKVVGIDVVTDNPVTLNYHDDGKLHLRLSPSHDGVDGLSWAVATIATASAGLTTGAVARSGLIVKKANLPNEELTYPAGFLAFAESAKYDWRGSSITSVNAVAGATLQRASFATASNQRWVIYFSTDRTQVTVPAVPKGFADRTMADGLDRTKSPDSHRSSLSFVALNALDGNQSVGLDELFDFSHGRSAHLNELIASFSTYSADPSVTFLKDGCAEVPEVPGACGVPDGNASFSIQLKGLAVPVKAKLLVEANTGEQVLVETQDVNWVAKAKFHTALQKDDDLKNPHVLTGTLVNPDADAADPKTWIPIDPKVSGTMVVVVAL